MKYCGQAKEEAWPLSFIPLGFREVWVVDNKEHC